MENTNENSNYKNISLEVINYILESTFITSEILNIKEIKEIKFLPSKNGYTIEVKSKDEKTYYMGISEFGYVEVVREKTIDGKIVYMPDDDYKIDEIHVDNKNIHTKEEMPWIDYLEIDENTLERHIIKEKTPKDIFNKYLKSDNYIIISSTSHFSHKKFNECLVDLKENKIYNVSYDSNAKEEFEYYKDLTDDQKQKLIKYISDNDLLNSSINIAVFDASDTIEIMMRGEHNIIRNASKEFTNNEMHIFDDIVDIVFNANNPINRIKNFFNLNMRNDDEINRFARQHGYDGAKYLYDWEKYNVYEPFINNEQLTYTGLPLVILVDNNGEIRMSSSDEAMAILDDKSFMESFEENKNIEELRLKREYLIKIKDEFKDERNEYKDNNIPNHLYLKYLEKIESILNSCNSDDDVRFIVRNTLNNSWISNDDAIDYLFDNIIGNIPILPTDVPQGQNLSNLSIQLQQYYNDGYVCSKEKDMLLNIINEIKKYINASNNESFIRKYKIDENGHEHEEFKNISIPKPENLSPNQVNDLIKNIDSKIAELEIEKNKIDKEIESNFEEVSKYSILNKTLEELLSAKKKFINDWDVLLFNTTSDHWIMNSSTYRVHLVSIIDAILRRTDDSISKQQLELLNTITENKYLGNKDRDSVIRIVKQLKELENK